LELRGKIVKRGKARGEALVTSQPISFLGGVDPSTGVVVERGHELEGQSINEKILVFPGGKGSTVGSYVIYQLTKNGVGPAAILTRQAEPIVAVGAIIAEIPMVHKFDKDPVQSIKTDDLITVDGEKVTIERR
jgi:hypothetical protein